MGATGRICFLFYQLLHLKNDQARFSFLAFMDSSSSLRHPQEDEKLSYIWSQLLEALASRLAGRLVGFIVSGLKDSMKAYELAGRPTNLTQAIDLG
jgi:hypothetical protein